MRYQALVRNLHHVDILRRKLDQMIGPDNYEVDVQDEDFILVDTEGEIELPDQIGPVKLVESDA